MKLKNLFHALVLSGTALGVAHCGGGTNTDPPANAGTGAGTGSTATHGRHPHHAGRGWCSGLVSETAPKPLQEVLAGAGAVRYRIETEASLRFGSLAVRLKTLRELPKLWWSSPSGPPRTRRATRPTVSAFFVGLAASS